MKMWIVTRTTAILMNIAVLSMLPAIAQNPGGGPGGSMRGRGGQAGMQGQRMLDMMTKELNLTPDQVTQVKEINADQLKQTMALRDDTSVAQNEKRAKVMTIREASQAKIKGVLTEEQKPKYEAMLAKMRERMQNRDGARLPPQP